MSRRSRIFFKHFIFVLIITLAFFLGLEGLLRILVAPPLNLFAERTDAQGRTWVQYRVGANRPEFLKEKPAGVFRIFAYGESSTMGIPYCPRSSFPKMLEFALRQRPGLENLEVINLGMKGMNSRDVRQLAPQSLSYHPDLAVIYLGQNELFQASLIADYRYPHLDRFLEFFRSHSRTYQVLMRSDKYLFMAPGTLGMHQEFAVENLALDFEHIPIENLPMTGRYLRDRLGSFRYNLGLILDRFGEKKIPVVLCTLGVNLKDWPPEWTPYPPALSPAQAAQLKDQLWTAYLDLADDKIAEAGAVLDHTRPGADDYAMSHYIRAWLLEKQGNFAGAREEFLSARKYDSSRHRAPPELNEIIRGFKSRNGVFLVDSEQAFFENTRSAPGFDLFVDHVHPNLKGQRLIADKIYSELFAQGLLKAGPGGEFPPLERFIREFQLDDQFLAGTRFLHAIYYLLQRRLPDRDAQTIMDLKFTLEQKPDLALARLLLACDYLGQARMGEALVELKQMFATANNVAEIQKTLERYTFPKIMMQGNYLLVHLNLDPAEPLMRGIILVRQNPEQTREKTALPLDQYDWIFYRDSNTGEITDRTAASREAFRRHQALCARGETKTLDVNHYFAVRPSFILNNDSRLSFKGTELNVEMLGKDPWMVFAVTLNPREVHELELKLAIAPEDPALTQSELGFYWSSAEKPVFSEDQKISLPLKADGRFHKLKITLGQNVNWLNSKEVLFLRVDPASFAGVARIKQFKISLCPSESSPVPQP